MNETPFFHEGMRALQDRFDGRRVADAIEAHRKHDHFHEEDLQLIATSPFFFIATAWGAYTDCSMKSGDPGFVRVTGPNMLEYPEYDGNSMYRTLGNISRNPKVGLLFVRFDGQLPDADQWSCHAARRCPDACDAPRSQACGAYRVRDFSELSQICSGPARRERIASCPQGWPGHTTRARMETSGILALHPSGR